MASGNVWWSLSSNSGLSSVYGRTIPIIRECFHFTFQSLYLYISNCFCSFSNLLNVSLWLVNPTATHIIEMFRSLSPSPSFHLLPSMSLFTRGWGKPCLKLEYHQIIIIVAGYNISQSFVINGLWDNCASLVHQSQPYQCEDCRSETTATQATSLWDH